MRSSISNTKRKPMKASQKMFWDDNGILIEDSPKKPAKAPRPKIIEKEEKTPKKRRSKVDEKEYFELQTKVKEAKENRIKKSTIKPVKRSSSVADFSKFIQRQNDSAKKHVEQPKKHDHKITYSNKRSQSLTRNTRSTVTSACTSRAPSKISEFDYLNDLNDSIHYTEKYAPSKIINRSSSSLSKNSTTKFNYKHFEKEAEDRTNRMAKKKKEILKENTVKPKIIRRNPDPKKLEELSRPKVIKTEKIIQPDDIFDIIPPQSPKKRRGVPKYITQVNAFTRSLKA